MTKTEKPHHVLQSFDIEPGYANIVVHKEFQRMYARKRKNKRRDSFFIDDKFNLYSGSHGHYNKIGK